MINSSNERHHCNYLMIIINKSKNKGDEKHKIIKFRKYYNKGSIHTEKKRQTKVKNQKIEK